MKHDNYETKEDLTLEKIAEDVFVLTYESEGYEFTGTSEEILAELNEHMKLMITGVK